MRVRRGLPSTRKSRKKEPESAPSRRKAEHLAMTFNSIDFCIFFISVYGLYWVLPHRAQNLFLLAASLVFYGWWDWRFLGLMAFSVVTAHAAALVMTRFNYSGRIRFLALVAGVACSLASLGFFKYYNFFASSLEAITAGFGGERILPPLSIVLPIGISFFTFQALAYVVDVYRREIEPARSFSEFTLFITYFPQLVAGPIVRAHDLIPQIRRPRVFDAERTFSGAALMFWGFFKKVFVADNLVLVVQSVYAPGAEATGSAVLIATYAFAIQIYCDFSGYTDIARGISRMMGFELMLNFNLPYMASSVRDFWRRWHISLSTYLRDYLYVPLGGSRSGRVLTYRNLMITMILGGLWHGAAWNFILWGLYQGLWLAWERYLEERARGTPRKRDGERWLIPRRVALFHVICFGWLLFRVESLESLGRMTSALFTNFHAAGLWDRGFWAVLFYGAPIAVADWIAYYRPGFFLRLPRPAQLFLAVIMFYLLVTYGGFTEQQFIYFQF
jgi:D-alanyl-lipoteichoic acid acyltransferase DltB (MBOAT superfamily)